MKLRVDHFSIAVRSMEATLEFFSRHFPIEMNYEPTDGYNDEFRWCDFHLGHVKIELIESARPGSFVQRFLDKRGEGIHHFSIEVDDLDAITEPMERDGLRIVDRFETDTGEKTAFISPRSAFGTLIQFWQVNHDLDAIPERPAVVTMPGDDGVRMRFDHLSMAVRELDPAMRFWERYFPIDNRRQRHVGYAGDFRMDQFDVAGYKVELIEGVGEHNFVRRFLEKRGEGFHHISIDVDRIDPVLDRMRARGIRIVDEAEVGNGYKTAFVSPRSAHGVLIQFWQIPDIEAVL